MPLLDHFRPPLGDDWPWDGVHSAWAVAIASQLNDGVLPADYYAIPLVKRGGQVEIDVAGFQRENGTAFHATQSDAAEVATAVWAPPAPAGSVFVDFSALDVFEIQVVRRLGGPQLRAAVELVSPSNKDRPSNRHAFAVKCASYLHRGVSVVVVDVVGARKANLHAEVLDVTGYRDESVWRSPTDLYATAYRALRADEQTRIEYWTESLSLGADLPTMPLWLDVDLCMPLGLEESYRTACQSLRLQAM